MDSRILFLVALLTSFGLCASATAQTAPPPLHNNADAAGVDLVTGQYSFSMTEGSIGSGPGAITLQRIWAGAGGWQNNWSGGLVKSTSGGNTIYDVEFGDISDEFTQSGSSYIPAKQNGASLASTPTGFVYVASDGTQIVFQSSDGPGKVPISSKACYTQVSGACSVPTSITRPDGTTLTIDWGVYVYCTKQSTGGDYCLQGTAYCRWEAVTSSAGYKLALGYQTALPGTGSAPAPAWVTRTKATFSNVQTAATAPAITYSYPDATTVEVLDEMSRRWHFETASAGNLSAVRRPTATSNSTTITYTGGYVSSALSELRGSC